MLWIALPIRKGNAFIILGLSALDLAAQIVSLLPYPILNKLDTVNFIMKLFGTCGMFIAYAFSLRMEMYTRNVTIE